MMAPGLRLVRHLVKSEELRLKTRKRRPIGPKGARPDFFFHSRCFHRGIERRKRSTSESLDNRAESQTRIEDRLGLRSTEPICFAILPKCCKSPGNSTGLAGCKERSESLSFAS